MKSFPVTELSLSDSDTSALVEYFYLNKEKIINNGWSGLNYLLINDYPIELQRIIDIINPTYFEQAYFYSNNDNVKPHIDKRRRTVISIPLNDPVVPTKFADGDVYYTGPTVFNTQLEHWVENPGIFRLFVQIELSHSLSIEECYNLYQKNELLVG